MNVYPIKNIAFKSIFISSPNIEKVTKNRVNNHKVSFVEIDVKNSKDIDALEYIAVNWEQGRSYAANIYNDAYFDYKDSEIKKLPAYKYYALTEQKNDFDTLIPEKVLGLVSVEKNFPNSRSNTIRYLQTNPIYKFSVENSKYKRIGTMLVDSLIKLFPKKNIVLTSDGESLRFYQKLRFENIDKNSGLLLRAKD